MWTMANNQMKRLHKFLAFTTKGMRNKYLTLEIKTWFIYQIILWKPEDLVFYESYIDFPNSSSNFTRQKKYQVGKKDHLKPTYPFLALTKIAACSILAWDAGFPESLVCQFQGEEVWTKAAVQHMLCKQREGGLTSTCPFANPRKSVWGTHEQRQQIQTAQRDPSTLWTT